LAGIYIHIPFCKQACHYCNFHFSTDQSRISIVVDTIIEELRDRRHFLSDETIETIYFGGGTPSILSKGQLVQIFDAIATNFHITDHPEITLEANPDDVTSKKLDTWKDVGITRISLGIQSLHDDDLVFMNRAHASRDCLHSLDLLLKDKTFEISVDLIFGYEGLTTEKLQHNLQYLTSKDIDHMSCYAMTIEPKTVFNHRLHKGDLKEMEDSIVSDQFKLVNDALSDHGFEHYEISNYCKNEKYAKHNTSYWQGRKYLGIGPSAHSFDGERRYWNVANNAAYIAAIQKKHGATEEETLSLVDKYNEYILTGLRTKWGLSVSRLKKIDPDIFKYFQQESVHYFEEKQLILTDDIVTIHHDFWPVADRICSDLFMLN